MIQEINVPKGADLLVPITLNDNSGNLINATTFAKLVVSIRHADGTFISKYSVNSATGYGPIDMTNASTGIISVKLLTTDTTASKLGKLFYEVHGQITDAAFTDDGVLDLISTGNYLCTIIDSITGGTTLP